MVFRKVTLVVTSFECLRDVLCNFCFERCLRIELTKQVGSCHNTLYAAGE